MGLRLGPTCKAKSIALTILAGFFLVFFSLYNTVKCLAPICSSTTSTIFLKLCLKQTHTARQRIKNGKGYYVRFLGTSWMLLYYQTSLQIHVGLCGQAAMYAWSQLLGKYFIILFGFCGITGCGSASLKLCFCNAASPWSQSPSPNSQWQVAWYIF